jgi:endonuclease/exonuclease/phosphatase family metal-dependent hydrolase
MESGDGQRKAARSRGEEVGEEKEHPQKGHGQEAIGLKFAGLLLLVCVGCRTGRNYPDPAQPRYGGSAAAVAPPPRGDTLRIVSFNIEYARETKRAMRIIRSSPELRDADVVLLQEMTAPAAKMVADSLGMHYVYYPAIYNRLVRHDFGNAILSRWPIVADAKLILPSRSRYAKTQRIATAATLQVGETRLRVYSTHFGTPADLGWDGRVAQLRFILDDAARYPLALIGGDMNSADIGRVAREAGYLWPTDTIRKSNAYGRLDHFFLRGATLAGATATGTHYVPATISDHSPVWIRIALR